MFFDQLSSNSHIRSCRIDGKTWYHLADICCSLDMYAQHARDKLLSVEEHMFVDGARLVGKSGRAGHGRKGLSVINGRGLARLVFASKTELAEKLRNDVLDGVGDIEAVGKTVASKLPNKTPARTRSPKRITHEQIEQWRRWKAEGLSGAEIARRSGKSTGTISRYLGSSKSRPNWIDANANKRI
jgi:prophage antirepressor-like protein